MSFWSQIFFQDAYSPTIIELIKFHDYCLIVLFLIVSLLSFFLAFIFLNNFTRTFHFHANNLEIFWTVIPAVILFFLAIPSLRLLYLTDELVDPKLTLKVIGHQWYWSYEYNLLKNQTTFDSFIIPEQNLNPGDFRLLATDYRAVLPIKTIIRFIISSTDVIHAWVVPRLLIKLDAIPGRLNQISSKILFPGVFYGQCSEICGANHSFIPISVEAINLKVFISWIKKLFNIQEAPKPSIHTKVFLKP
jgi:cytochrome c oxidase subunit 2